MNFKKFYLFLFALATPILFMSLSICECGDYDTGTTTYAVNSHGDCCDQNALVDDLVPGFTNTWDQQNNGVYQITSTTVSSSSDAQSRCCD